ncbi:MAG: hypothetical protein JSS64_01020 [Bacteroidetes bacterium]|nr:hypothetical protein [Bacteroidota bacterium]
MTNQTQNHIVVLIPYFGKLPTYFPFFLESCKTNPQIDFLIFTDDDSIQQKPAATNIKIYPFQLSTLNQLASQKLQTTVSIKNGYKLCDFKPMYGKIFEDYITSYSFWGFSDIDIILGNIKQLFTQELLQSFDVISLYDKFISGPFCLFRNTDPVNTLFFKSSSIKEILTQASYCGFDEMGSMDAMRQLWSGVPISETNSPIESFSHLVLNKEKFSGKCYFKSQIIDCELSEKEKVVFQKGQLFFNDTEIFLYHYLWNKSKIGFNAPPINPGSDFFFTQFGFFYPSFKSKTIDWGVSVFKNFRQKAKRKLKNLF